MKICPVCKTTLFDDMEVCYGCMYTFGSKPELEQRTAEEQKRAEIPLLVPDPSVAQTMVGEGAPAQAMPMAGWCVRLEMKNTADPTRSWTMELMPQPASATAPESAPVII